MDEKILMMLIEIHKQLTEINAKMGEGSAYDRPNQYGEIGSEAIQNSIERGQRGINSNDR